MEETTPTFVRKTIPDLSLAMPCYNEEDCLEQTVPPLVEVFQKAGIDLELVLVDNGSVDQTSAVIDRLIAQGYPIRKAVVPVNRGQGLGIRTGLEECRGRHIGYLAADGQVAPESVLLIYRAVATAGDWTIAKVRRRFRPDSLTRKIISVIYNVGMLIIFPGMPSMDVNGSPRIMPRGILPIMELSSSDWFLEAEIMLKVQHLRMMVIEIDVPGHLRQGGRSNVRWRTILEFMRNIARYRMGGPWCEWRRKVSVTAARQQVNAPGIAGNIQNSV
jgi:dolichol-phosphate mannosyltransferase